MADKLLSPHHPLQFHHPPLNTRTANITPPDLQYQRRSYVVYAIILPQVARKRNCKIRRPAKNNAVRLLCYRAAGGVFTLEESKRYENLELLYQISAVNGSKQTQPFKIL